MSTALKITLGVLGFLGLYVLFSYNSFVSQNTRIDGQFAQVDSQYQRRLDLINNLVAAVKGSMAQEEKIFLEIADARSRYADAKTTNEKVEAIDSLDSSFSRLLVISENYPTLKSSENVNTLMVQVEGTENRIAVERMRYNELVTSYNASIKMFPGFLLANIFNFQERKLFKAVEGAEKAPQIDLTK